VCRSLARDYAQIHESIEASEFSRSASETSSNLHTFRTSSCVFCSRLVPRPMRVWCEIKRDALEYSSRLKIGCGGTRDCDAVSTA